MSNFLDKSFYLIKDLSNFFRQVQNKLQESSLCVSLKKKAYKNTVKVKSTLVNFLQLRKYLKEGRNSRGKCALKLDKKKEIYLKKIYEITPP